MATSTSAYLDAIINWPFLNQLISSFNESPITFILYSLGTLIAAFLIFCIIVRLISSPVPVIVRYDAEYYYHDPRTGRDHLFPSLMDDFDPNQDVSGGDHNFQVDVTTLHHVDLSVIVPAYNEEKRLPSMLDEAIKYLEKRRDESVSQEPFTYEIIIVDDGSKDGTTKLGLAYVKEYGTGRIRVLTLNKNRGKGGAVRLGVLSARGRRILFADADGATQFSDYEKLDAWMNEDTEKNLVAIGSRAHLEKEAIAQRSFIRNFLMKGFHSLVWFCAVRTVRDTQCGFKCFDRKVARVLFPALHVQGWAFDVELLFLCEQLLPRDSIREIAVKWEEIEGSKIVPVFSWIQMGKDVVFIALKYAIGAWRAPSPSALNDDTYKTTLTYFKGLPSEAKSKDN